MTRPGGWRKLLSSHCSGAVGLHSTGLSWFQGRLCESRQNHRLAQAQHPTRDGRFTDGMTDRLLLGCELRPVSGDGLLTLLTPYRLQKSMRFSQRNVEQNKSNKNELNEYFVSISDALSRQPVYIFIYSSCLVWIPSSAQAVHMLDL